MMLYVYALVEPTATLPAVAGMNGHELALLVVDRVAAVVGAVDAPLEATDRHLLTHARVVDGVAAVNETLLPVRFGRGFHDVDQVVAALAGIAPQLERRLRALKGCVELGVHVAGFRVATAAPASGGGQYMRRRLREVTRIAETHATLAERARESTCDTGTGALLRAAYLVPRSAVEDFLAAVEQLRERRPELTVACTGPWPPYSFAWLEDESP